MSTGQFAGRRESAERASPRVTIVIPTYRRPDLLRTCLQSVKDQTFTDFVALVCDNSLEREGQAIVAEMDDSRFQYVARETNLGILKNAITGFQQARSELVFEVDDDDVLYPQCLEKLVAPFDRRPEITVSFGDVDVIDMQGEHLSTEKRAHFLPVSRGLRAGLQQPFTTAAARGHVYMFASVLRRDAIDWFAVPEDVGTAYDRHLALAAARHDRPAWFVDEVVMAYRVHATADGVTHEADQLLGAVRSLEHELPFVTGRTEAAVRRELVRRRLMLVRAATLERRPRASAQALRMLPDRQAARWTLDLLVREYLPRQAIRLRDRVGGRRQAWRRQRRRRGHGL